MNVQTVVGQLRSSISIKRFMQASLREKFSKVVSHVRPEYWAGILGLGGRLQNRRWKRLAAPGVQFGLGQLHEPLVFSCDDEIIGRSVFFTGEFDFTKFRHAMTLLRENPVTRLIDVGANIGTICIPAVSRGYADRAIAIEPDPLNFRLLECNILLNDLRERVASIQVAATSSVEGTITLEKSGRNHGDHRVQNRHGRRATHESTVQVRSARLDDLIEDFDPRSDLLWMDVQGYEVEVLLGASRLIQARVPMVIELWPFGIAEHSDICQLTTLLEGYEFFVDLSSELVVRKPLSELGILIENYGFHEDSATDILVANGRS